MYKYEIKHNTIKCYLKLCYKIVKTISSFPPHIITLNGKQIPEGMEPKHAEKRTLYALFTLLIWYFSSLVLI
ncbi:hypothetical protein AQUCO_02900087v1 [Aquilegia coerulea]|uniref:Uncharacterized protein n=1 Tax=Aquilegia coerulea TaxID=218851 RepID=A0A2G5D455_AQUCA|nr:hypothetical protein AQUCO_02900087v1 [Aquilegia coerulea]